MRHRALRPALLRAASCRRTLSHNICDFKVGTTMDGSSISYMPWRTFCACVHNWSGCRVHLDHEIDVSEHPPRSFGTHRRRWTGFTVRHLPLTSMILAMGRSRPLQMCSCGNPERARVCCCAWAYTKLDWSWLKGVMKQTPPNRQSLARYCTIRLCPCYTRTGALAVWASHAVVAADVEFMLSLCGSVSTAIRARASTAFG